MLLCTDMERLIEPARSKPKRAYSPRMANELEQYCPVCETERTFWLTASMELHLGLKTKWSCPECAYGVVRIDGDIDSSAAPV